MAQQPLVGQSLLIIEASPSHWVRQATFRRTPVEERFARHRDPCLTTHNTNRQTHILRRDPDPQSQKASGGRATLRRRGHWDRRINNRECKKRVSTWLLTITDFVIHRIFSNIIWRTYLVSKTKLKICYLFSFSAGCPAWILRSKLSELFLL